MLPLPNQIIITLDGDEVDDLVKQIKNRINLMEGNITHREFERLNK